MPRFDLRQDDETLDPLATFKVLAVMCHPDSLAQREQMLALLHAETGHGQARRRSLSKESFMREVSLASTRAGVAGWLLLTMLQLQRNGHAFSLNSALPLVSDLLPRWQQPVGPYWFRDAHVDHHPHSRRKLLEAYRQYRPVAHLWAAMIHGQQHERDDIWPGSLRTLPVFLAYAEAFLDLGCTLPSRARDRRFVLTRPEAWVFAVPDNTLPAVRLEALPLDDSQRRVFRRASSP